jgi:tRNA 2-thiouridine synthesizing protein A
MTDEVKVGTLSTHQLDARGLLCPMPVIRTQQRVAALAPGDVLEVTATDPGVLYDIPAWCRVNGHQVLDTARVERDIIIRVLVGGNASQ